MGKFCGGMVLGIVLGIAAMEYGRSLEPPTVEAAVNSLYDQMDRLVDRLTVIERNSRSTEDLLRSIERRLPDERL